VREQLLVSLPDFRLQLQSPHPVIRS
jgi:hypothetical protein